MADQKEFSSTEASYSERDTTMKRVNEAEDGRRECDQQF